MSWQLGLPVALGLDTSCLSQLPFERTPARSVVSAQVIRYLRSLFHILTWWHTLTLLPYVGAQQLDTVWTQRYSGVAQDNDLLVGMVVSGNGNVTVTGSGTGSDRNFDYVTLQYRSDGFPRWSALYNAAPWTPDISAAIAADSMGAIVITGYSGTYPSCKTVTVKYDSLGMTRWIQAFYGTKPRNRPSAVQT
ncbi:MAG: hypothetical protein ABIK62_00275, partial [candidate division WOR-3 bacterium]